MYASKTCYLALDGDRVGERIARALIANDEQQLTAFASAIEEALSLLKESLRKSGYKLLLTTGDGVLAHGPLNVNFAKQLVGNFHAKCRCHISAGIGNDLRSTYLALKFAKSHGGGILAINEGAEICLA